MIEFDLDLKTCMELASLGICVEDYREKYNPINIESDYLEITLEPIVSLDQNSKVELSITSYKSGFAFHSTINYFNHKQFYEVLFYEILLANNWFKKSRNATIIVDHTE